MIPHIPQRPPNMQSSLSLEPNPEPDLDGYPKRSVCIHCQDVIAQAKEGAPWTVGNLFGGDGSECHKAPNPDDGPMPGHEPGTVLHPPKR